MAKFIVSGFADEASMLLDEQMDVMERHGAKFIEPRGVDGKNVIAYTEQEAGELYKRMSARGFGVSAIGSPIGKVSIEEPFEAHFEAFLHTLKIAQALHAPYIRLFSFFMPEGVPYRVHRDEVLRRMDKFVTAAQGTGVTLLHENEKHIYGDIASRCWDILHAFKGGLYATYDFSNFVQCDEDNRVAFPLLRPFIKYVHMKDSVYSTASGGRDMGFEGVSDAHRPVGLGDGHVKQIMKTLLDEGYEGFISLEPHLTNAECVPGTPVEKYDAAMNALKALMAEIGATLN